MAHRWLGKCRQCGAAGDGEREHGAAKLQEDGRREDGSVQSHERVWIHQWIAEAMIGDKITIARGDAMLATDGTASHGAPQAHARDRDQTLSRSLSDDRDPLL